MTHSSLESHLEENCPQCKEKHDSKWSSEHSGEKLYVIKDCPNCNYKIYKKKDFMSCGKIPDLISK